MNQRILDQRWRSAVKEARQLQDFLGFGYLVMRGDERVEKLVVDETGIYVEANEGRVREYLFMKNVSFDNGYHTSAAAMRKIFREFEIYAPIRISEARKNLNQIRAMTAKMKD